VYHPEPGDLDLDGWEPAPVRPFWALTNDQRRNLRRDAFDAALETVQRRGGDPDALLPAFVAAFDAERWYEVETWLRGRLPSRP
jgi:hypothetical protein